jgi:glycosyltransferase involved in cell wall biosynthesis
MRIVFLCKQRYTGRDVIHDCYGRLYEFPRQLAESGHDVHVHCFNYHGQGSGQCVHEVRSGSLNLYSHGFGRFPPVSLFAYPIYLLRQFRKIRPDLLIGASDIPHVVLTSWLAHKLKCSYAIDLYDNFESFGQARIPCFVYALRKAVRGADLVTVVSAPLKQKVEKEYFPSAPVIVVPNAIDKNIFKPGDKLLARKRLGLPADATLIGTAGGLYRTKGIAPLYKAWTQIERNCPNVHLVLAGPIDNALAPPQGERVHYLGHLPYPQVAELFSALDLGIVTVLDSAFGRYCFPQKAYEMLACQLPVIASDVGVMSALFKKFPQALYPAENVEALAQAAIRQLHRPVRPELDILNWWQLVGGIELELRKLTMSLSDQLSTAISTKTVKSTDARV